MINYEVFISHSHKDKAVADAICHCFEDEKIKCWIAPRDITPGINWADAISDAIPACKIFLLVFSANANLSQQVYREVELAVKNKLVIVPVRIEDTSPTRGMEYYLSAVHWIDVVNKKTEKYLTSLVETVKDFIETKENIPAPLANIRLPKRKKIPSVIWISAAAVVFVLALLGIIFKDSLFGSADETLDASATQPTQTIEITAEPTAEPTPAITAKPTAEPSPTPTATIDVNISSDTVVNIPDIVLKSCVLKTLNDLGYPAENNIITVEDMQRLETLAVVPDNKYIEEAASSARVFILNESDVLKSDVGIETLEGLQYANNLKCLILIGQNLKDISALSQTHNLEYVDFKNNNLEDISSLSSHFKLKTLLLSENSISDISSLMLLYNLSELFLGENPIDDITPIKGLFSLQILDISGLGLENLEAVSMLENLTYLNASGSNIGDISILHNLVNVIDLIIEDCNIESIYFPTSMNAMTCLHVAGNEIIDSEEFLNFPNLSFITVNKDIFDENSDIFDELEKRGCEILTR